MWRYLLYKYDFQQSVVYFSRLIQCLFTVNEVIVKIEEVQWYINQTDCLVQLTVSCFVFFFYHTCVSFKQKKKNV